MFNEGKYWEAHEAWESVWRVWKGEISIADPGGDQDAGVRVTRLQGLIQACGAFHLLRIGRVDPAKRLARSALGKLRSSAEAGMESERPAGMNSQVWVNGLEPVLERLAAGEADVLAAAMVLRVRVAG